MQRCCTPADENERAVRYTLPRPGERAQVGSRRGCQEQAHKSDRGRFQAPPFVAPTHGKHARRKIFRTQNVRLAWPNSSKKEHEQWTSSIAGAVGSMSTKRRWS